MAFLSRNFWQLGRTRRSVSVLPLPLAVTGPWRDAYVIMTAAGHKPSGLADIGGGDQCACRQASWSHLDEFGPYGGCPVGWYDAREFLARYGIRDGAE